MNHSSHEQAVEIQPSWFHREDVPKAAALLGVVAVVSVGTALIAEQLQHVSTGGAIGLVAAGVGATLGASALVTRSERLQPHEVERRQQQLHVSALAVEQSRAKLSDVLSQRDGAA
jgi:uncharacterized membrane protein